MRDLSRQSFLGPHLDRILSEKTIGIIGLNGGGSQFVQQLAHIGFKNFVVCDPQTVDNSNLNRNVLADLDSAKAAVTKVSLAVKKIRSLNPSAPIDEVISRWQEGAVAGKFDKCDIIIGCVDSLEEREQIERLARRRKVPYIDIGMDVRELSNGTFAIFGQAIMTLPEGPCLRCLGFIEESKLNKERSRYGDAGVRPQVIWPNGSLVSLGVGFLMHYFFNWSQIKPAFRYKVYDGSTFDIVDSTHASYLIKTNGEKCSHF